MDFSRTLRSWGSWWSWCFSLWSAQYHSNWFTPLTMTSLSNLGTTWTSIPLETWVALMPCAPRTVSWTTVQSLSHAHQVKSHSILCQSTKVRLFSTQASYPNRSKIITTALTPPSKTQQNAQLSSIEPLWKLKLMLNVLVRMIVQLVTSLIT